MHASCDDFIALPAEHAAQAACSLRQDSGAHESGGRGGVFPFVPAAVALALALALAFCASAQEPPNGPRADATRDLGRLVDAVASRNKGPKLVNFGVWCYAIFDERFDWSDQKRVQEAVWTLSQDGSNGVFARLMEHIGDSRYSVTSEVMDPLAENWDVGTICRVMAREKLLCAYLQHLEPGKTQPYGGDSTNVVPDDATDFLPGELQTELHRPPQLRVCDDGDMVVWYRTRKGVPLYKLQIEMCEWAIKTVGGARGVAEKPKKEFIAAVEKEVVAINESKRPAVDHSRFASPIGSKVYRFFDAEMARGHRERCLEAQKAAAEEKARR